MRGLTRTNVAFGFLFAWVVYVCVKNIYGNRKSRKEASQWQTERITDALKELTGLTIDPNKKYNVFFFIADNMRPNVAAYRDHNYPEAVYTPMHTPNLDALAKDSMMFTNAFVSKAFCGPSRACILTGRRPESTKIYSNSQDVRDLNPNIVTMPQYFMNQGHWSVGYGKVFHDRNDAQSFNVSLYDHMKYYRGLWNNLWHGISLQQEKEFTPSDALSTNRAILALRKFARMRDEPNSTVDNFFIALGFFLPHQQYYAPQRFFDLYPLEKLNPVSNNYHPENAPKVALRLAPDKLDKYDEFHNRGYFEKDKALYTIPEDISRQMKRAYYACISYVDEQVGRVLKEIENLDLEDDTIVSFLSDHGYQMGERGHYGKRTNARTTTNIPMFVKIPGRTTRGRGKIVDEMVESIDMFPTLVEAAGYDPLPQCKKTREGALTQEDLCTEGRSLLPLLRGSEEEEKMSRKWRNASFTQAIGNDGSSGMSILTPEYRYTEWFHFTLPKKGFEEREYDWDNPMGVELYDTRNDFFENHNLAEEKEYKGVIKELRRELLKEMKR